MMRRAWTVVALVALAGCQTSGYTSGERVTHDCAASPIQSSWSNAYTPSYEPCIRSALASATLNSYEYYRHFQIPGGFANIVFAETLSNTYITPLDALTTTRIFNNVEENGRNWSAVRKAVIAGRPYTMVNFEMAGKPCVGFVSYDVYAPNGIGFKRRLRGYACANRMDYEEAENFVATLSVDPIRVSGAIFRPYEPKPVTAPKAARTSVPAAASAGSPVATPPPAPSAPIDQRLATLKDLADRKLITPAEYEAKRKEILGGL